VVFVVWILYLFIPFFFSPLSLESGGSRELTRTAKVVKWFVDVMIVPFEEIVIWVSTHSHADVVSLMNPRHSDSTS
jgi:hypothetical protein